MVLKNIILAVMLVFTFAFSNMAEAKKKNGGKKAHVSKSHKNKKVAKNKKKNKKVAKAEKKKKDRSVASEKKKSKKKKKNKVRV
jgi:hypothetical protein